MSRSDSDDEDILTGDLFAASYVEKPFKFSDVTLNITLSQASSTDFDLTGQVLWPAASILCSYIEHHKADFQAKKVLEVGAGVGLCGLLAAQYASETVITDGIDEVVGIIQRNVAANPCKGSVHGRKLAWERLGEELPWYQAHFPEGFDIVMGSDVVFWEEGLPHLFKVADALLGRSPRAAFLLAYQSRSVRNDQKLAEVAERTPGLQSRELAVRDWAEPANPHLRFLVYTRR